MKKLYEGKSKTVYATEDPERVILRFKDDATAFNGVKHALIPDKARINARCSAHLLGLLGQAGVRHHLIEPIDETSHLCHRVQIIPVEVVVRNICAGSLAKRYGKEEGLRLTRPLVELFYKSDQLDDPLLCADVAVEFGWATRGELDFLRQEALSVNRVLQEFWAGFDIDLVDFKLEFGRAHDGNLLLADEITPDGSRLWERGTGKRFDKDVFRRDLGDLGDRYRELEALLF
jgi:phosphoribosylaminoimidazole-succinocarboxamide synthase